MPLRLTLELIPRGDESRKRVVGTLEIENTDDHPKHPKFGNYRFRMTGQVHGDGIDVWHEGEYLNMPREGYWSCVKEILDSLDCKDQPNEQP